MKFKLRLDPRPWKQGPHHASHNRMPCALDWQRYDSPAVVRKHGVEYLNRIRRSAQEIPLKTNPHPSKPRWMVP